MDLFALALVIGAVFAVRAAWQHATRTRAGSRDVAVKKAQGKSPKPLTKPRQKMIARQHDIGWWLSEAAHGFPVLRTGLHAGWLAHKAAAMHGRHKVQEARTTEVETRASFAPGMAEHRKRQAEAWAEIRSFIDDDPRAGRKAVQKAAGNVLPFARPKAAEPVPEPAREPEPGPYAPQAAPPPNPNPDWWEAAISGRCSHGGHGPDETCDDYQPDDTQPQPPEGNHSMPTGTTTAADATYDGTQRELTQMAVKLEAAINEIRFEQFQNQVEMVATSVTDPQTLGDLSDTSDELQRAKEAMQRSLEATQSAKSRLRHNHGNLNEASQGNPVAPADKEFYQEG